MFEIPFADFVGRLQTSHTRVKFSHTDPYGHMGAGHYVNLAFDHRIEALNDQLQFDPLSLMKTHKMAFFARDVKLGFVAPSASGDALEVTSWLRAFTEMDHDIRVVIAGQHDRIARCVVTIRFIFVDVQTKKPVPVPASLPSRADRNLILELPPVGPYLDTVKGVPRDWKAEAMATPREP